MFDVLKNTKIEKIMDRHIITVNVDEEFSQVHVKFSSDHVTHLVVVDMSDKVVGIISQKYFYKTKSPRKVVSEEMQFRPDLLRDSEDTFYTKDMLDSYILSKIMQKNPFTMHPEDNVAAAVVYMAQKKIGCIPIVDKNNLIKGVLTHMEIINFIGRNL